MTDQKNTILAIVLSAIVLIAWQYFVGMPQMEKQRQEAQLKAQQQQTQQPATPVPQPGSAPQPGAPAQPGAVPAAAGRRTVGSRSSARGAQAGADARSRHQGVAAHRDRNAEAQRLRLAARAAGSTISR